VSEWDEREPDRSRDPGEGVRIIGPDEAAEAMERGDAQPRLRPDRPRYGDRPSQPPSDGPRPSMRFPLDASADLDEFERPPVAPIERHRPPTELSHWDESAAEEVPNMSRRDPYEGDEAAWSSVPGAGPRWREDDAEHHGAYDARDAGGGRRGGPRQGEPVAFDEYADPAPGRSVFGDESSPSAPRSAPPSRGPVHDEYEDAYRDHGYDDQGYGQQQAYADESYADERGGYDRGAERGPAPGPDPYAGTTRPAEGFDQRQVFAAPADPPGPRSDDVYDDSYSDDVYDDSQDRGFPEPPSRQRGGGGGREAAAPRRSSGGDRDMRVAAGVGVGLLVAALVLFQLGTVATMVLVTAILGVAAYEYFTATQRAGFDPLMPVGVTATVGAVLAAYNYGEVALPLVVVLSVVVCLVWYLIDAGGERPMANIGATLLGICWVGIFGSFAGLLLMAPNGIGLLVAAIVPTIGYDVGALFVGRSAGSRPLSSASPNKTVEGLVGGMVLALLAGTLLGAFGPEPFGSLGEGLKVGLVVAIAAPLGDLSESLIKRDLGIKDMGTLLPGHGGVLDRFDALLFVLPAIWYLARVSDFFLT
jgi:phosphatidate cytidylyltransferase